MVPKQLRVIAAARAAGYKVVAPKGMEDCTLIMSGKTMRRPALMLCPDGTAFRADVELSMALIIRTERDMMRILRLAKREA